MAKQIAGTPGSTGITRHTPDFATKDNAHGDPWIPASPAFIFMAHPARWRVLAGTLVPLLGKQVLVDGVNNIEYDNHGRVRFNGCRAKMEDEGWTLIPYEWGPGGESYLQTIATRPNGKATMATAYVDVWTSAYAGDARPYGDLEAYTAWLAELVKSGKLPGCPPQVARRLLEGAQARLAEAKAREVRSGDAESQARVSAHQLEVKALTKAAGKTANRGPKATATAATLNLGE